MNIAGIDYGSKLAGTSVIAYFQNGKVQLLQSAKKQDADKFILEQIANLGIEKVFLDAPLSLPAVYKNIAEYDDFFYRKADKLLKGMSPMFLGGLTARAMRLKQILEQKNIEVREIYPAQVARMLDLKDLHYKKQTQYITGVCQHLLSVLPFEFEVKSFKNWHQVDALLALYSAWRFERQEHELFGDLEEGQIVV